MKRTLGGSAPLRVILRPARGAYSVAYGGSDASGEGYGTLVTPLGMAPLFRMGLWCSETSEKSSNWQELRNLLELLKRMTTTLMLGLGTTSFALSNVTSAFSIVSRSGPRLRQTLRMTLS